MSLQGQARSSIELEDPLTYLPRREITEYKRGEVIFDEERPSDGVHLVVRGSVKAGDSRPERCIDGNRHLICW